MYYHHKQMKFVEYGRVGPAPIDTYDKWELRMYEWLGHHCGFSPQVWLSRSRSSITGIRRQGILKKQKYVSGARRFVKEGRDSVLFGFDIIKGFSVSYDHWEGLMNYLMNEDNFAVQNKNIIDGMNEIIEDYRKENLPLDGEMADWVASGCDLDNYLKNYVFKEVDQIVVPFLNLKSAKQIICRNEKQKKVLRKMGFIEDRIKIRNIKCR